MTFSEAYLFLFFDSIMSSLLLVPNTLMVYPAMKIFGYYNQNYMLSISIIGLTIGSTINYGIGILLHYLKQNIGSHQDSLRFKHLMTFINNKLFWIPVLSFLPLLGVIITISSGFFRVRLSIFLVANFLGHALGILLIY